MLIESFCVCRVPGVACGFGLFVWVGVRSLLMCCFAAYWCRIPGFQFWGVRLGFGVSVSLGFGLELPFNVG